MLCESENCLKSTKIVLNYLTFITALISRAKCHFTLIKLTSLCSKFHSPSKNQIKKNENKTTNLTSSLEIFKCQKLPPEIIKIHPLLTSEAFFLIFAPRVSRLTRIHFGVRPKVTLSLVTSAAAKSAAPTQTTTTTTSAHSSIGNKLANWNRSLSGFLSIQSNKAHTHRDSHGSATTRTTIWHDKRVILVAFWEISEQSEPGHSWPGLECVQMKCQSK